MTNAFSPREAPTSSRTFAWTLRLYDALPMTAGWTGAAIAASLYLPFLMMEVALGRAPIDLAGQLRPGSGEALIALLLCALLGYLCTISISAVRDASKSVKGVRQLLDGSAPELDSLVREAGTLPRRTMIVSGLLGVAIALLFPFLEIGQENWSPYDWRMWTPESAWHRALTPAIGWWSGRLIAVMLLYSRRHSALASRIREIDLLDLRGLHSFTTLGLSNALRVSGVAAIFSLLLVDIDRYQVMVLATAVITVSCASTALLLPVRGVHLRIRAAKHDELDRINRAIRGEPHALRGSVLAAREISPSLSDLVAYRSLVESVREWPFDATTFRRFGLYLMIPLGSWMGGALVERLLDAALD